jgi:hypothetical protein
VILDKAQLGNERSADLLIAKALGTWKNKKLLVERPR